MAFSVSGNLNGRWEIFPAETATEAAAIADQLHEQNVMPVHIKKDGVLLEDPDEFEATIAAEKQS